MSKEYDITIDQARSVIAEYGGYGSVRVYFVHQGEYEGQIGSIKSTYQLDDAIEKDHIGRLYAVANDGTMPIGRA